jgi:Flp pilus assembly protein TadG
LRCRTLRSSIAGESGQALVEFALVLPVLLLVLLAMLDFGKVFNYWIDGTQITAEGARYAAVNRKPDNASTDSLQEQLLDSVDTNELHSGSSSSLPTAAQVCVSFPNGTSNPGDPVRLTLSFTYHWLGFLVRGGLSPTTTVTSSSTMRLETPPTNYSAGCT